MSKVNFIITVCLLLLTFGCVKNPPHAVAAYKIMNKFSNQLYYTQKLKLFGSGGKMLDDVKVISLFYECADEMDLCNARNLLVKNALDFVDAVNSDKNVIQYLHNYPFTVKNLELGISFIKSKKQSNLVDSPYIAYTLCDQGRVIYCVFNPAMQKLDKIHEETFEEALRIVQNDKSCEILDYSTEL